MEMEHVYKCNRCAQTFDTIKIVQDIYGTRHCNNCINELRSHELRERIAILTRPTESEDISIPIRDLLSNI